MRFRLLVLGLSSLSPRCPWSWLDILKARYARGEFSNAQVEELKRDLADPLRKGNACGNTLGLSWWVKRCPGLCTDPAVTRAADLMGHYYLIRRRDHWLVWAAR
jgi:hypothetical protein